MSSSHRTRYVSLLQIVSDVSMMLSALTFMVLYDSLTHTSCTSSSLCNYLLQFLGRLLVCGHRDLLLVLLDLTVFIQHYARFLPLVHQSTIATVLVNDQMFALTIIRSTPSLARFGVLTRAFCYYSCSLRSTSLVALTRSSCLSAAARRWRSGSLLPSQCRVPSHCTGAVSSTTTATCPAPSAATSHYL